MLFWGVAPFFIGATEMDEQNVTQRAVGQICDRLKCKISEVFGED